MTVIRRCIVVGTGTQTHTLASNSNTLFGWLRWRAPERVRGQKQNNNRVDSVSPAIKNCIHRNLNTRGEGQSGRVRTDERNNNKINCKRKILSVRNHTSTFQFWAEWRHGNIFGTQKKNVCALGLARARTRLTVLAMVTVIHNKNYNWKCFVTFPSNESRWGPYVLILACTETAQLYLTFPVPSLGWCEMVSLAHIAHILHHKAYAGIAHSTRLFFFFCFFKFKANGFLKRGQTQF